MKFPIISAAVVLAISLSGISLVGQDAPTPAGKGEGKATPESIYGAYELKLGDGAIRKRFISHGRWAISQSSPTTGEVIFHHGGAYVFDGVNYIETVDYANGTTLNLVRNRHKFIITVKEGSIHMKGVDNPWDEEWVRVNDESSKPSVDLSIPTVPPAEKK